MVQVQGAPVISFIDDVISHVLKECLGEIFEEGIRMLADEVVNAPNAMSAHLS